MILSLSVFLRPPKEKVLPSNILQKKHYFVFGIALSGYFNQPVLR